MRIYASETQVILRACNLDVDSDTDLKRLRHFQETCFRLLAGSTYDSILVLNRRNKKSAVFYASTGKPRLTSQSDRQTQDPTLL